jgi:hypothetical protein
MKYWDYLNYNGSLEDTIRQLTDENYTITSVTILKYAKGFNTESKQSIYFPIRALIIYNTK